MVCANRLLLCRELWVTCAKSELGSSCLAFVLLCTRQGCVWLGPVSNLVDRTSIDVRQCCGFKCDTRQLIFL